MRAMPLIVWVGAAVVAVGVGCTDRDTSAAASGRPANVQIATIAPLTGTDAGGTNITITGGGFETGTTVLIGGAAATNIVLTPPNSLTCDTPAGTAGPVDVAVTGARGGVAVATNGFTYTTGAGPPPPTLATLNPTFGPTAGGTTATLTGTGFQVGAIVTVGGVGAISTTVKHGGLIVFVAPPGAAANADVVVTNPDAQTGTLTNGWSYGTPTPTVATITVATGPTAGGTPVTITGTGFQVNGTARPSVTIGGVPALGVWVQHGAQLTCTTGVAGVVGPQAVVVTNPDGQFGTLVGGYTYVGPSPVVSTVSPGTGPQAGGTSITITGSNFFPGATVTVGGSAATSVVVVSPTQITCTTPAGAAGPATIVVTNLDGNNVSAGGLFSYV